MKNKKNHSTFYAVQVKRENRIKIKKLTGLNERVLRGIHTKPKNLRKKLGNSYLGEWSLQTRDTDTNVLHYITSLTDVCFVTDFRRIP